MQRKFEEVYEELNQRYGKMSPTDKRKATWRVWKEACKTMQEDSRRLNKG